MEIITMDNEVVKTMMEKIDRIADYVFKKDNVSKEEAEILLTSEEAADLLKNQHEDTATDAKGQDYSLHDGEKQMPVQTDGSGGMRETENRTLQSQDAGGVQA